jgi:hypothetical protein
MVGTENPHPVRRLSRLSTRRNTMNIRNTLLMSLVVLMGTAGCAGTASVPTGTSQVDEFNTGPSAYSVQQVTNETRRYCRSRARRCMVDENMRELYPSWSQRSEQCRQNYEDCVNRNEGFFIRQ